MKIDTNFNGYSISLSYFHARTERESDNLIYGVSFEVALKNNYSTLKTYEIKDFEKQVTDPQTGAIRTIQISDENGYGYNINKYVEKVNFTIIAILVVPYLFLFLAYLDSQLIQKPFSVKFDYRSPDQIKNVYIESYTEKLKVMKTLSILSIVSIVSLSLALITAFVIKNNQKESPKEDVYISGTFEKEKNKNLLVFTSKFPKQSLLRIQIVQQFYDSSQKKLIVKDSSFPILNSQSGNTSTKFRN